MKKMTLSFWLSLLQRSSTWISEMKRFKFAVVFAIIFSVFLVLTVNFEGEKQLFTSRIQENLYHGDLIRKCSYLGGNDDIFKEEEHSINRLNNERLLKAALNLQFESKQVKDSSIYKHRTRKKIFLEEPVLSCNLTNLVGFSYIDKTKAPDDDALKMLSESHGGVVKRGGKWKPTSCTPKTKVAIVVPLRGRKLQLKIFKAYMHPFLQRQNLDYQIFVIEQGGTSLFNRGALSNIGFKEAMKAEDFDCIVITDVDLIPENDYNMYDCKTSPSHLSVAIDKFNYHLPYPRIFGGVGAWKPEDFIKVNGYSNIYWGWGCEDDDLYTRVIESKMKLHRPPIQVARYTMIMRNHERKDSQNPKSFAILERAAERYKKEGLSTLIYTVLYRNETELATRILIDILPEDHIYRKGKK